MDSPAPPAGLTIDVREYARQQRRHAYEHLTPGRTALVVVDMVPFFVAEALYALDAVPIFEVEFSEG